jgi:hypothetical protein
VRKPTKNLELQFFHELKKTKTLWLVALSFSKSIRPQNRMDYLLNEFVNRDTVLDHSGLDLAFKATSITAASVTKLSQTHFATNDRLFATYIWAMQV